MTAYLHIVKATNISTGRDVVYSFFLLDDAESKMLEFESNDGFTGAVIYENVRSFESFVPFDEELYGESDSRYVENLDSDLQQP